MNVNKRLLMKGYVQGVGYRAYVKQTAMMLRLKGTVKNLPDGDVEIYCSVSTQEAFDKFKELLRDPDVADVDEIIEFGEGEEGYGTGPEKWLGFNIIKDEFSSDSETLEFIALGGRQMLKKQDKMLDKQDQMLDKQDETLASTKDIKSSIEVMNSNLTEKFD